MKKILFIDLSSHQNTLSTIFLMDLLRTRYEVTVRYVSSRHDPNMPTRKEVSEYDGIVYLQFSPSVWRAKFFHKPQIYVPMYDNETYNYAKWLRIKLDGGRVISFTDKEGGVLRLLGLKVLDVRYYTPKREFHPGSVRRLFLWDRGYVQLEKIMKLFKPSDLDEIVYRCQKSKGAYYQRLGQEFGFNVKIVPTEQYLGREEYLKIFYDCGIFVAPRLKEGIGMSFLEGTALGKCVIAHDDATMNEYLTNNETGILVNLMEKETTSLSISEDLIQKIQRQAYNMHVEGRRKWDEVYKNALLDFVESAINEYKIPSYMSCLLWFLLLPIHFLFDVRTYLRMKYTQWRVRFIQKRIRGEK